MVLTKAFSVYKRSNNTQAVSVLLEKRDRSESLLFESGAVAELASWETVTIKKDYNKLCDAYGCLGVLKLSLNENVSYLYLVLVTGCHSVGKIKYSEISCVTSTVFIALGDHAEIGISEVRKLLNSGSFYFTISLNESEAPLDLSLSYQSQCVSSEPDNRFFWNHALHAHLQKFTIDCSAWLINIMCGGIELKTVYAGARQAKAMVISRLSCERAGTRFNVRGVNDDGHVANFVETEQVIVLDNSISAFLQTRGSVPIFWEQPGIQVGSHKVKISRGFEASQPAFDKHIFALKSLYGDQLLINLLGSKEGESFLSAAYQKQLKASVHCGGTPLILFDYHRLCKGGKREKLELLKKKAEPYLNKFGFFVRNGEEIVREQTGTIRVNCLDCLDRTNAVQSFVGLEMLQLQLVELGLGDRTSLVSRFVECFRTMWANNGNLVSRTYTGTGAMEGGARFGSKLHDGAVSVRRTIKNNFFDGSKQEAIDILLLGNTFVGELGDRARALLQGAFLHGSSAILRELCDRHLEYTKWRTVRVCIGTFNVNGGRHFRSIAYKHQSLDDWLLDFHLRQPNGCVEKNTDFSLVTDIFAIGFEELVDLKAGNILSTSAAQRLDWGDELKKVISRDTPYVLLTCEQLVGVCLFVFVRAHLVEDIRDVAVDSVKTGLGGSAGNKGGVAIRFLLHSTSLCFVCSHFAAGQSNVADRNSDYHDIVNKIEFPMGRTVLPHDYVFWCGDFNYRIDLPMEDVKEGISQDSFDLLQVEDQLTKSRKSNKCFRGFNEGKLTFAPTYKFDPFSDDYDTSEKMRIPAWTDRVLWRRRKPASKCTENTVVDGGGKDSLVDIESECSEEDDEEEENNTEDESRSGMRKSFHLDGNSINWSVGKLLYYHSAQLKTSDHRPVVALIEIEIQSIDQDKESDVHNEVIMSMGPADPTVIITSEANEEINTDKFLSLVEDIGETVLVRVIDNELFVTFDDGRSALQALELNNTKIDDVVISVRLKSDTLLSKTDMTVGDLGGVLSNAESNRARTLSEILKESPQQTAACPLLQPIRITSQDSDDDDESDNEDENDIENEDAQEIKSGNSFQDVLVESMIQSELKASHPSKRPAPPSRPQRPARSPQMQEKKITSPCKPEQAEVTGESVVSQCNKPCTKRRVIPRRPEPPNATKALSATMKADGSLQSEKIPALPRKNVKSQVTKPSPPQRHADATSNNIILSANSEVIVKRSIECVESSLKHNNDETTSDVDTKANTYVSKNVINHEKPVPPARKRNLQKNENMNTTTNNLSKSHFMSQSQLSIVKPTTVLPARSKTPPPRTPPSRPPPPLISTSVEKRTEMQSNVENVESEAVSPSHRKKSRSLKLIRKKNQEESSSSVNISGPFDVKHVTHVDVNNVKPLLGISSHEANVDKIKSENNIKTYMSVQDKTSMDQTIFVAKGAMETSKPVPVPRRKPGNNNSETNKGSYHKTQVDSFMPVEKVPPKLPPRPVDENLEFKTVHSDERMLDTTRAKYPPEIPRRPSFSEERTGTFSNIAFDIPEVVDLMKPQENAPIPPPRKGRKS